MINFEEGGVRYLRRTFARSTNYGYTLRDHDLIGTMCVQIPAAHEACLSWMCVNPSKDHHVFLRIYIVKERGLIDHLARVTCVLLLRNYNLLNENCVGDNRAAQHATCLEISSRV